MDRDLPPLNALRAFEAAGRHLSLTKAAAELHVTPAAISHQVKGLEDYLGVKLFRRAGNSLLLSDAGQACLPRLSEGFDRLAEAIERLKEHDARGPVHVSVAPAFASKWLVPRLERFDAAHPDVDVRISASLEVVDLDREGFDAAIRLGRGSYPGHDVHELFPESVVPMCRPDLIEAPHPLRTGPCGSGPPERRTSTRRAALTSATPTTPCRPRWTALELCSAGAPSRRPTLAAGRLGIPFDLTLPMELTFFFVCPHVAAERPKIVAFRDWLLEESHRV